MRFEEIFMRRLRYIAWILVVLPGLSLSTKGDYQ